MGRVHRVQLKFLCALAGCPRRYVNLRKAECIYPDGKAAPGYAERTVGTVRGVELRRECVQKALKPGVHRPAGQKPGFTM